MRRSTTGWPPRVRLHIQAASPDGSAMVEMQVARPGDTEPQAAVYPKLQYLVKIPGWN